jgi:hypothetical protein
MTLDQKLPSILSASSVPTRTGDSLLFSVWSSAACTIDIVIRYAENFFAPITEHIIVSSTAATARTAVNLAVPLISGQIISIYCSSSSGLLRGQCFIKGEIRQGRVTGISQIQQLVVSGYITTYDPVIFPGNMKSSLDGEGMLQEYISTDILAVFTLPANSFWKFISLGSRLITSSAAGDRTISASFLNTGDYINLVTASIVQPLLQTYYYSIGDVSQLLTLMNNKIVTVKAPLNLKGINSISLSVDNSKTGDALNTQLWVEEFLNV